MVDGFNKETDKVNLEKLKIKLKDKIKYINIDDYSDYEDFLKKEALLFENTKVIYNSQPGGSSRPLNLISQWYKRWKGFNALKTFSTEYDKVVLTRFDLRLFNILNMNNDKMEISNLYNDETRGYSDIFFSGSFDQIRDMVDVYPHLSEMIEDNVEFCGHSLMKWWLLKKQIPFDVKSYKMSLFNTPKGYCAL